MKVFEVELRTTVYVCADSESEAETAVRNDLWDCQHDQDPTVTCEREVHDTAQLRDGWTAGCYPYGQAQTEKTLEDLLPANA